MTAFALTSTLPAAPRAGFGRVAQIARDWNDRRITRREIARLDAHLLRDIGVDPRPVDPGIELMRKARIAW